MVRLGAGALCTGWGLPARESLQGFVCSDTPQVTAPTQKNYGGELNSGRRPSDNEYACINVFHLLARLGQAGCCCLRRWQNAGHRKQDTSGKNSGSVLGVTQPTNPCKDPPRGRPPPAIYRPGSIPNTSAIVPEVFSALTGATVVERIPQSSAQPLVHESL